MLRLIMKTVVTELLQASEANDSALAHPKILINLSNQSLQQAEVPKPNFQSF